jgi:putative protein-disulfide isomerase
MWFFRSTFDEMMNEEYCDPLTGECKPAPLTNASPKIQLEEGKEIIYVGDPMCSWCWGISNHLKELRAHYAQYKFTVVVGGLRPGGGDVWDDKMKQFLQHHWAEVTKRSGQPFGSKLFDLDEFNYDTEPPCRAVVAARKWVGANDLEFFESVSRKFYVENEDPATDEFYRSVCEQFGIPFDEFIVEFHSNDSIRKTYAEFQLNRNWGVTGYPTVLFRNDKQLYRINNGYCEFEQMQQIIDQIVASKVPA